MSGSGAGDRITGVEYARFTTVPGPSTTLRERVGAVGATGLGARLSVTVNSGCAGSEAGAVSGVTGAGCATGLSVIFGVPYGIFGPTGVA